MIGRRPLLAATGAMLIAPNAFAQSRAPVRTSTGSFLGTVEDGVRVFRGIRYGVADRFMAPRPAPAPAGIQPADRLGASCPQRSGDEDAPMSEDCLFLNVWTPDANPGAKKPVMVYIHGGAYSNGSGSHPMYDGSNLATHGDVVVVTLNHRLNAFGYLYLARFDPRFADSGNTGQLDLILALQWVKHNIAAFGGDPGSVMVFGQSGGGAKIATMMGMPAAQGLFHRAATMSGQQVTASGPLHATDRARAMMAKLGARDTNLAPLLEKPAEALVEALGAEDPFLGGGVYMGPVLDMKWLTRHPFWPDANPIGTHIPMILGNTHDETRAFLSPDSPKVQGLTWDNIAERMAPELRIDVLPEWVVGEYRAKFPDWSVTDVFYAATTAGRSWRGQVIEAEERAKAGAPAWVYQLNFGSRTDPRRGAFHTMDIPLVFGTLDARGSQTGTAADARAASQAMQQSFLAFARTGNPNRTNKGALPAWPKYTLARRPTMIFDVKSHVENDPRQWQRELFARIPYIQPGT